MKCCTELEYFTEADSQVVSLTSNLVDILKRQTQWLVERALRWINVVQGVHDCHSGVLLLVGLCYLPALEPRHLWTTLEHVVAVPAGYRHKRHSVRVVTDLLDICRHFLLDFIVAWLQHKFQSVSPSVINSPTSVKIKSKITFKHKWVA